MNSFGKKMAEAKIVEKYNGFLVIRYPEFRRDVRREYWIYAVERGSAAQMSVEKVRHAQRECLSERVTWFACALVKEKVADKM